MRSGHADPLYAKHDPTRLPFERASELQLCSSRSSAIPWHFCDGPCSFCDPEVGSGLGSSPPVSIYFHLRSLVIWPHLEQRRPPNIIPCTEGFTPLLFYCITSILYICCIGVDVDASSMLMITSRCCFPGAGAVGSMSQS
jgi:hypothetical protein